MKRLKEYDVFSIPVGDIYYDAEFNCRGEFTLQSVKDLAESIRENGLQFPIVVQPYNTKPFRLLAGHRRYKAATTFLKWNEIPAQVRPKLTEKQARILNFTENLERKDLNILEEAKALANTFGRDASLRTVAAAIKRDTRWVHVRFKLLDLPDVVQTMAAAGQLSTTNICSIWRLKGDKDRIFGAQQIHLAKGGKHYKSLKHLDPTLRDCYRPRKRKEEIRALVAKMLNAGVEGLGPRLLVWATGALTDKEIWKDVQEHLKVQNAPRPRA